MKRRTRPLALLVAACAVLGAAVWLQVRREHALARDPLTTIDLAAVRALRVDCRGCTPRRFERVDRKLGVEMGERRGNVQIEPFPRHIIEARARAVCLGDLRRKRAPGRLPLHDQFAN